jgi:hypothetical protein
MVRTMQRKGQIMEENFNYAFMVGLASILWIKVAYDAGRRKGYLEGRKAVRKYYEQVGR